MLYPPISGGGFTAITLDFRKEVDPDFKGVVSVLESMGAFILRAEFRKLKSRFGSGDSEFIEAVAEKTVINYHRTQLVLKGSGMGFAIQDGAYVEETLKVNLASELILAEWELDKMHLGTDSALHFTLKNRMYSLNEDEKGRWKYMDEQDEIDGEIIEAEEVFAECKSVFKEFECDRFAGSLERKMSDMRGEVLEESTTDFHPVLTAYLEDFNLRGPFSVSPYAIGHFTRKSFPSVEEVLKGTAQKAVDYLFPRKR